MTDVTDWTELLERLALALAIGFLVGVERGWKHRQEPEGGRVAGIRTFTLIGLLGGISGLSIPLVGPIPAAATAVVLGLSFAVFQLWQGIEDEDASVTSTVAGILVFALGLYACVGDRAVATAGGVVTSLVLAFKQPLHSWLRSLTWPEIRSALLILAASFIALPLLPEGPIDPWGVFDPRAIWLLTILIAGASFAGYVVLRTLGSRAGQWAAPAIGALVSSTAVTIDLARRVRRNEIGPAQAAASAAMATSISLTRVTVLSAMLSGGLGATLASTLVAATLSFLAGAIVLPGSLPGANSASAPSPLTSPFELIAVARTAMLLGAITVLADLASRAIGTTGLAAFSAAAGLADVDAATVAVARLVPTGISLTDARDAALAAVGANQLLKIAMAWLAGSNAFGLRFLLLSAIAAAAGAVAYFAQEAIPSLFP